MSKQPEKMPEMNNLSDFITHYFADDPKIAPLINVDYLNTFLKWAEEPIGPRVTVIQARVPISVVYGHGRLDPRFRLSVADLRRGRTGTEFRLYREPRM